MKMHFAKSSLERRLGGKPSFKGGRMSPVPRCPLPKEKLVQALRILKNQGWRQNGPEGRIPSSWALRGYKRASGPCKNL